MQKEKNRFERMRRKGKDIAQRRTDANMIGPFPGQGPVGGVQPRPHLPPDCGVWVLLV